MSTPVDISADVIYDDTFSEEVEIQHSSGGKTIFAIVDRNHELTPMGPVQVDNGHAIAYCSSSDVEGLDNTALLIAREVTYKVTDIQTDLDGFTLLLLSLD